MAGTSRADFASYFAVDARVGWRVGNYDISVVGRNLGPRHREYLPDVLFSAESTVQPTLSLRLGWGF